MITKGQALRIKSYVEDLVLYNVQLLENKIQLEQSEDEVTAEFVKYVSEITERNAEETAQNLLSYLDSITKQE